MNDLTKEIKVIGLIFFTSFENQLELSLLLKRFSLCFNLPISFTLQRQLFPKSRSIFWVKILLRLEIYSSTYKFLFLQRSIQLYLTVFRINFLLVLIFLIFLLCHHYRCFIFQNIFSWTLLIKIINS